MYFDRLCTFFPTESVSASVLCGVCGCGRCALGVYDYDVHVPRVPHTLSLSLPHALFWRKMRHEDCIHSMGIYDIYDDRLAKIYTPAPQYTTI